MGYGQSDMYRTTCDKTSTLGEPHFSVCAPLGCFQDILSSVSFRSGTNQSFMAGRKICFHWHADRILIASKYRMAVKPSYINIIGLATSELDSLKILSAFLITGVDLCQDGSSKIGRLPCCPRCSHLPFCRLPSSAYESIRAIRPP